MHLGLDMSKPHPSYVAAILNSVVNTLSTAENRADLPTNVRH